MKYLISGKKMPLAALLWGGAGMALHGLLYLTAMDEKNLLVSGHPLALMLWLLSAAAAVRIVLAVRPRGNRGSSAENFPGSRTAAAGCAAFGVCIVLTVLSRPAAMAGGMGEAWRWLGLLAFVMLCWAGYSRMEGKQPCFAAHLTLCAFLAVHLITHYRRWSGDPQLQDYVFTLLGFVALLFYAYSHTAFDVGFNRRRLMLGSGLFAMYLLLVGMFDTPYWLLHVGGVIWVWSNFCAWDLPEEGAA